MTWVGSTHASIQQTSANITVADPGVAGACLIAIWECDGFHSGTTPPDGTWTQLFTGFLLNDDATYYVWVKNSAVGSGSYTFTGSASNLDMSLTLGAWSGIDQTTPIDVTSGVTVNNGPLSSPASVSAPSVTTVTDGVTVVFIAIGDPNSNTPNSDAFGAPSGYTSRTSFFDASGWNMCGIADIPQSTHGATGGATGSFTRTGATFGVAGFTIPLRPAASVPSDSLFFGSGTTG